MNMTVVLSMKGVLLDYCAQGFGPVPGSVSRWDEAQDEEIGCQKRAVHEFGDHCCAIGASCSGGR